MSRARSDHLVSYISTRDLDVVLGRVPEDYRSRLRDVFCSRDSRGVRWLGYVQRRGRRDITLCSVLPPRLSLGRYLVRGQTAADFGAPRRGQWPPWAVRRFLLYDTLLHELGHLQIVRPRSSRWDRRYASETLAQQLADELRAELWAENFRHPDPVHNAPRDDELCLLPVWIALDKDARERFVRIVLAAPHARLPRLDWLGQVHREQLRFLRRALLWQQA